MGSKFFDALQEKSSRDEYGELLGRLICFYLRQDEGEFAPWNEIYPLTPVQKASLDDFGSLLASEDGVSQALVDGFHKALMELFLWEENERLMEEMACPVQRFLLCASIHKRGKGFIHVRDVGRLIAKLLYGIRSCVYMELMMRSQARSSRIGVNKELNGLGKFVLDLIQTPFGFLREVMHLAAHISGDGGSLPQISWLGKEEYRSLAIHGKKVELSELGNLSNTLLKKATMQLNNQVKMGIHIKQWGRFHPADDMWNEEDEYSFISTLQDKDLNGGRVLVDAFMSNGTTRAFFASGMNRRILWHKGNCLIWLKRCKKLVEMLAVLCHLLGGQPARATEVATLRWRNSGEEQRGTYWVNGTMMLLARYSKTRAIIGRDRPIPR